jgi:hypothetical protein
MTRVAVSRACRRSRTWSSLPELLDAARSAQAIGDNPSPIVLAAVMSFVLLWPGARLLSRLEHRMLLSRG